MASSGSTAKLSLNQWVGADKPKMEDFNRDNRKIEEAVVTHLEDTERHILPEERALWNAGVPAVGSFTGDGQNERQITLDFAPSYGIVFAVDQAPVRATGSNVMLYSAFLGPEGASLGIEAKENGFSVYYVPAAVGGRTLNLNVADVVYQYIMFR